MAESTESTLPAAPAAKETPGARRGKVRGGRKPRILPVLILAAATLVGLRIEEWISAGGFSAMVSLDGERVDLGPGRPLMAQENPAAEPDMADAEPMPAGDAMAQAESEGEGAVMSAQDALEQLEAQEAALPGGGDMSDSEIDVLMALRDRRSELDEREAGLDQREALLRAAEMRIDEKVDALDSTREEIEMLLGQLDDAEEERLTRLVQVYEIMKPDEAATILDGLERDVLLSVMERMTERKLAPILAAMNPALARELTADLSLRRRVPELPES